MGDVNEPVDDDTVDGDMVVDDAMHTMVIVAGEMKRLLNRQFFYFSHFGWCPGRGEQSFRALMLMPDCLPEVLSLYSRADET